MRWWDEGGGWVGCNAHTKIISVFKSLGISSNARRPFEAGLR